MSINIKSHILFEDEVILVINKPAGLMVEPDRNNHSNLLHLVRQYIKSSLPPQAQVYAQHIHRLDRPVSGIVLFAKQRAVLKNLSEQFADRKVKKYYQALTAKAPILRVDTLEHWHRKEKKKAVLYTEQIQYSEKAILKYKVNEITHDRFLWDIELHTGKFHQIRAQLAQLDCPVIGDTLYGSGIAFKPNTIALHAGRFSFFHPITHEEMTISVEHSF